MYKDELEVAVRLQQAQLKIYQEIDRVCKLLKIDYMLAFGTCIGAVRHHGFIPWDDDIDLCMRVEDLDILHENAHLFDKSFFVQNRFSDPQYRLMITRIRDNGTTLIETTEEDRDINHGIFVDIYPLYNCSDSRFMRKKQQIDSMLCRLMLYGQPPKNKGSILTKGSSLLLKLVPEKYRPGLVEYLYRKYHDQKYTGYMCYHYGNRPKAVFSYDWLFPVRYVEFEDLMAPIPSDYDNYLRQLYKGEYMELPPENERVFHHEYAYIDFDHSYLDYKGSKYCKKSRE